MATRPPTTTPKRCWCWQSCWPACWARPLIVLVRPVAGCWCTLLPKPQELQALNHAQAAHTCLIFCAVYCRMKMRPVAQPTRGAFNCHISDLLRRPLCYRMVTRPPTTTSGVVQPSGINPSLDQAIHHTFLRCFVLIVAGWRCTLLLQPAGGAGAGRAAGQPAGHAHSSGSWGWGSSTGGSVGE
jgi:hypothetical protein